ncbi:MAG TPA: lysine 2,3-aminomutase [Chloroflexi bacterium]|nr:lysine 2,3-aminomutase [Chloroflexota bacterium]
MSHLDFPSKRAPFFQTVSDDNWNDWRWQMRNRLRTVEEFEQLFPLSDSEKKALDTPDHFRVEVTPYFASLINPEDPHDPIRPQVIPTSLELVDNEGLMEDSLAEDLHSPVPGLVHRYPDRALMLVTTQCATYCRYCTRSRIVGNPHQTFSGDELEAQLDYLESTPAIRDVVLSGGDPLSFGVGRLESLLKQLRAIKHIEIIRIGSRIPVFLPQRITSELTEMLGKYHPLWLNIHVNHPNEITAELAEACDRLSRAGIPLGNQSVLLAGINDCVNIQRELVHKLTYMRVRPYYLYQCDLVHGAGHFRTPVGKGIEIIEGLRGHTSGFAVPTYVVDAPGGGGKVPLSPSYLISMSDHKVVVRNYEGYIATYEEPTDYQPHNAATCTICQQEHLQDEVQEGVSGLLSDDRLAIRPEGFSEVHKRGATAPHRLQQDQSKWTPHKEDK